MTYIKSSLNDPSTICSLNTLENTEMPLRSEIYSHHLLHLRVHKYGTRDLSSSLNSHLTKKKKRNIFGDLQLVLVFYWRLVIAWHYQGLVILTVKRVAFFFKTSAVVKHLFGTELQDQLDATAPTEEACKNYYIKFIEFCMEQQLCTVILRGKKEEGASTDQHQTR